MPDDAAAPANRIPDQYVVVLKPEATDVRGFARSMSRGKGDSLLFVYEHALKGFAVQLAPASVDALRKNPLVKQVLQDEVGVADQSASLWSLDRADQRVEQGRMRHADADDLDSAPLGSDEVTS